MSPRDRGIHSNITYIDRGIRKFLNQVEKKAEICERIPRSPVFTEGWLQWSRRI